jgi:hypothetical protein
MKIFLLLLWLNTINLIYCKDNIYLYIDEKNKNYLPNNDSSINDPDGDPLKYKYFSLLDNDLNTALNMEFDEVDQDKKPFGRIEIPFIYKKYPIDKIVIYNGYQKNDDIYYKNARVKDIILAFYLDDYNNYNSVTNTFFTNIMLQDKKEEQEIYFKNAIFFNDFFILVESTYPGTKYQDIAISEIEFWYQGKKYEVANLKKVMDLHMSKTINENKKFFPQVPIIIKYNKEDNIFKTFIKLGITNHEELCYLEFRPSDSIIYYYQLNKLFFDNKKISKIKNINKKNAIPIGKWYFNEFGIPYYKLNGMEWKKLNYSIYGKNRLFIDTELQLSDWWFPYPQKEWPFQLDPSDEY